MILAFIPLQPLSHIFFLDHNYVDLFKFLEGLILKGFIPGFSSVHSTFLLDPLCLHEVKDPAE